MDSVWTNYELMLKKKVIKRQNKTEGIINLVWEKGKKYELVFAYICCLKSDAQGNFSFSTIIHW